MQLGRGLAVVFVAIAALMTSCGGRPGVVKIGGPSLLPNRVTIRTLEPGPTPTPAPSLTPTPSAGPTPTPLPPPAGATLTSKAGTQEGAPNSNCWSDQIGGPTTCYQHPPPTQPSKLVVAAKEITLIKIDAHAPPDDESVRPFQKSRAGYPSQSIDPALETDLTVDLPKGEWLLDVCATWHGRGDPVCWLFRLDVH